MITRKGKAQQNPENSYSKLFHIFEDNNEYKHNKGKSEKCLHISCNFDLTKNNC